MKILKAKPPIYDRLIEAGLHFNPATTVFAYGDTIYNPTELDIPDDVVAHEELHCEQQGDNPDGWWERYIQDPYFRIQEESEAYGRQYAYICQRQKDRNRQTKILFRLATFLCSPGYGSVIGHSAAMKMIKDKASVHLKSTKNGR